MKVRRKTNQPSSQSVLQSLLVMFVSIWESKHLLKCFWLFYLSRPCFPGEIVGLLKTEMKQLSVLCLNILISRITRKKGLRKLVRNLRKSCVKFLLEKSCCCAKACDSWLQPPSGSESSAGSLSCVSSVWLSPAQPLLCHLCLLFLRIFNLCNSVACAGYSIFYQNSVLRKAAPPSSSCCLCLFLPLMTTKVTFGN